MKMYFFLAALFLTLFFKPNVNVEAQTVKNQEANEVLKIQIDQLQKDLEELKDSDDVSKKELFDALLNREKDISSSLYNFTMLLMTGVTLFVTIGAIYISYMVNKLKNHQKKIDLVLDSKDFDNKMNDIEQRLLDFRLKERNNIISDCKRQFKILCKEIDSKISDINTLKNHNLMKIEDLEEILKNNEWEYLVSSYQENAKGFNKIKDDEIDPNDDAEEDVENLEENLVGHIEDLESLLEEFEKIEKEIEKMLINN